MIRNIQKSIWAGEKQENRCPTRGEITNPYAHPIHVAVVERKLENFKVGHGYRLRARAVGRVIAPGNRADSLLPSDSRPCISFSYSISFFNSQLNTKVILHCYFCRRYVNFHTKLTGLRNVLIWVTNRLITSIICYLIHL